MFKRKLIALDFHNPEKFDVKDESQFRNLITWLEDQKIRHYKIEDRIPLRTITAGNWTDALQQYIDQLGCPVSQENRTALVDWLLGYAVRLEYGDSADKYRQINPQSYSTGRPAGPAASNPLDSLDSTFNPRFSVSSPDFKAGVLSLASMLQIPPHHNDEVVLKAVCLLIKEKLSKESLEMAKKRQEQEAAELAKNPSKKPQACVTLDKIELGFDCGDYISNDAAKILRLLHVRELRDLQDQVNEAIVAVQTLTANPKTDTRLGKVGR